MHLWVLCAWVVESTCPLLTRSPVNGWVYLSQPSWSVKTTWFSGMSVTLMFNLTSRLNRQVDRTEYSAICWPCRASIRKSFNGQECQKSWCQTCYEQYLNKVIPLGYWYNTYWQVYCWRRELHLVLGIELENGVETIKRRCNIYRRRKSTCWRRDRGISPIHDLRYNDCLSLHPQSFDQDGNLDIYEQDVRFRSVVHRLSPLYSPRTHEGSAWPLDET